MESKVLEKSINNIVTARFFARTLSRIQRIVKICDVVDLFLWKPFWFFLSMFSILGCMRLRSRALYILAAMDVRVIPQKFMANPRLPCLVKGGCILLSICRLYFDYIRHYSVRAVCCRIAWSSILLGVFYQALLLFYFWFFLVLSRVLLAQTVLVWCLIIY